MQVEPEKGVLPPEVTVPSLPDPTAKILTAPIMPSLEVAQKQSMEQVESKMETGNEKPKDNVMQQSAVSALLQMQSQQSVMGPIVNQAPQPEQMENVALIPQSVPRPPGRTQLYRMNRNTWSTAEEYRGYFEAFLSGNSPFPVYNSHPNEIYTQPSHSTCYFLKHCDDLKGPGGFGFPKTSGSKKYFWKKFGFQTAVPRDRPIIVYNTCHGRVKDRGSNRRQVKDGCKKKSVDESQFKMHAVMLVETHNNMPLLVPTSKGSQWKVKSGPVFCEIMQNNKLEVRRSNANQYERKRRGMAPSANDAHTLLQFSALAGNSPSNGNNGNDNNAAARDLDSRIVNRTPSIQQVADEAMTGPMLDMFMFQKQLFDNELAPARKRGGFFHQYHHPSIYNFGSSRSIVPNFPLRHDGSMHEFLQKDGKMGSFEVPHSEPRVGAATQHVGNNEIGKNGVPEHNMPRLPASVDPNDFPPLPY
eukprot:TRINITY_DN11786_c0_g1_i1.p1 TRINITY_DN11786_c0_g1~~TRINITY_DN11786_c0_g1_i1.p1  ORF type:complete len:472 (-),score=166.71 TRINITY_DN11786_c0_g1_i1:179-1594(-)